MRGQGALFGDALEGMAAEALVSVAADKARLSPAQREFNRLAEKIRGERAALAAWDAYRARYERRLAGELEPLERELSDAQRRLARRLDELLARKAVGGERLGRRHRAKARLLIVQIIEVLLLKGPDSELERLYERHGDVPPAERCRQDEEMERLLRGDARRQGRRKAVREPASPAREGSQPVREIYRKLASAFHPDREMDGAERERKTALMQRANQAYDSGDLLQLLALQIETGQADCTGLAALPEERLRHYNEVLRGQFAALKGQVEQRAAELALPFGVPAYGLTAKRLDLAIDAALAEARNARAQIERDLLRLDDPPQRRAFLDELPDPEPDLDAFDEIAALAAIFSETAPAGRRRTKRRRR